MLFVTNDTLFGLILPGIVLTAAAICAVYSCRPAAGAASTNLPHIITAIGVSLAVPSSCSAQQQVGSARWTSDFVVLAGTEPLTAERLTRSTGRLESDFLSRQQAIRVGMVMTTGADGLVSRLETSIRHASDSATAPPMQQVAMTFARDTLILSIGSGTAATVQRLGMAPGTMPFVNLSAAVMEQLLIRAKVLGGGTATIPLFAVAGGQMLTALVRWIGTDTAVVAIGAAELRANVSPSGQLLGAMVPSSNVRFVRSDASAGSAPVAVAPPDYSAPAGAPYTAEDVRVRNEKGGITLAGTLTIPRHASGSRVPAVVMITGSGPEDRDSGTPALPGWKPFRQIADTLGRRGIAVLRLDDRGVGGSDLGSMSATSADFADDIRAALAYLRTRGDIDGSKLGLIGHSEGGMIAPMVAATDSSLRGIRADRGTIPHRSDDLGCAGARGPRIKGSPRRGAGHDDRAEQGRTGLAARQSSLAQVLVRIRSAADRGAG
ncbi:MAG: alpha/beta hydrolase [Gemmatimonadota bacterium]